MTINRLKTIFIVLLGLWLAASTTLVWVLNRNNVVANAVISMGTGLVVFWVFTLGSLMWLLRTPIKDFVQHIPLAWQIKFVIFATLLAMTEEAITTGMTNLAPLFGAKMGQAYITASANYFDVILHHSVIVFFPMFIAWAWLLSRYRFSPFCVFLLFGITGTLAESLTFGMQNLLQFGMWIFVYGLMVYLPAFTIPEERGARPVRWWHAILAVILPFFAVIPVGIILQLVSPNHPDIHFPPIVT